MESTPIRVLHIEDTEADAAYVRHVLSAAEETFAITHVDRFLKGMALLETGGFDVALLDLYLPDSRGRETYERACLATSEIPIVLMTGIDDAETARAALREGVQDYLCKKHVDTEILARTIRYAIERKSAMRELQESRERFALAMHGANDGLWDWDLKTDTIYFSQRWKAMIGYENHEIGDKPEEWINRIHPIDRERVIELLAAHRRGETPNFSSEHLIRRKGGSYMWILVRGQALWNAEGHAYRMAGSQTDIGERKNIEMRLRHDAMHDSLTGLANRALLMNDLSLALARAKRHQDYEFALLFLDIDRFKMINDSLGHVAGDELLKRLAHRLKAQMRPEDTVARLGGDEFVALLSGVGTDREAAAIANRLQAELNRPIVVEGYELTMTASIGLAFSRGGYDKPEDILRDADTAMYGAKGSGRSRLEVFSAPMHDAAVSRLELETDLRQAMGRGQIAIYYQPIVSLANCRLTGFEALARWKHPTRGLIYPSVFIPLAEDMNLIQRLGAWMLEGACSQVARWIVQYPALAKIFISVNLSGSQLLQPDFADYVATTIEKAGLEPHNIKLELTESTIVTPTEVVYYNLKVLRELGIRLQLDDFGTGYSSLSYLQGYPIDNLKIDKLFVDRLLDGEDNRELVRTIAAMAGTLKMQVTAEGVETSEQLDCLRSLNVSEGQGYYFSEPLDSDEALLWLMKQSAA